MDLNVTGLQPSGDFYVSVLSVSLVSLFGVFVVGLALNICVILTIFKTPSLRTSSVNLAVLSLIFADLIEVGLELPAAAWIFSAKFWDIQTSTSELFCGFHGFLHILSSSVQVTSVTVIALERYFSISSPFDRSSQCRRVNFLIAGCWLFSSLLSIFCILMKMSGPLHPLCNNPHPISRDNLSSSEVVFVMMPIGFACIVLTGFFYCLIVCTVCQQKRRSLAKQAATSNLIPMKKVEVQPQVQINIELPSDVRQHCVETVVQPIVIVGPNEPEEDDQCQNGPEETDSIQPNDAAEASQPSMVLSRHQFLTVPADSHWSKVRKSEIMDEASSSGRSSSSGGFEDDSSIFTDQVSLDEVASVGIERSQDSTKQASPPGSTKSGSQGSTSSNLSPISDGGTERKRLRLRKHFRSSRGRRKQMSKALKHRSDSKMAKRSGYIVLIFFLTWLPLPIATLWASINLKTNEEKVNVLACAYVFSTLTSIVNPIVYGLAIDSFRKACKSHIDKHLKTCFSK